MKISEPCAPSAHETHARKNPGGSQEGDFQTVMDEVLRNSAGAAGPPPGLEGPLPQDAVAFIGSLHPIEGTCAAPGSVELVRELEGVLEGMSFYADKLAVSGISAGHLAPLLVHLEERLVALNQAGSHPDIPEKLGRILSDVTLALSTEAARFRRGDYGTPGGE